MLITIIESKGNMKLLSLLAVATLIFSSEAVLLRKNHLQATETTTPPEPATTDNTNGEV